MKSPLRLARAARSDERGAVLVIYSIVLIVLFMFIAVVIDLAALSQDSRNGQMTADFSAMAAAAQLNPIRGANAHAACRAAWRYFVAQNRDVPAQTSDPCSTFAGVGACTDSTPARTATGTVGAYTITITTPIPDGSPLLEGRLNLEVDGRQCERVAVQVQRTRGYTFAGIMNASGGFTTRPAVATGKLDTSNPGMALPLVVLDPVGCRAFRTSGQATVQVRGYGGLPGGIQIDSAGTQTTGSGSRRCTSPGNDATVEAGGTAITVDSVVDADGNTIPGVINSYALMPGQGNSYSYRPVDVTAGRLSPVPIPGERATRSPVDDLYNCKAANDCPYTASRPPHIDNLVAAIGTSGTPAGYQLYTGACNTSSNSAPVTVPPGNWYVNCSSFTPSNSFTFQGGNVVFAGSVTVGSSGTLTINSQNSSDSVVYLRSGNIGKNAQASLIMNRTTVYLASGVVNFGAGSGALTWVAPTAGNFKNLALWAESSAQQTLGGQASLTLEGLFFTPNADHFNYSGQAGQSQTKAQFISYRLELSGQGTLVMQPDPERMVLIPVQGVRLIR